MDGLDEAMGAARTLGIEVLPGTEVSADFKGREVHVVGLGVQPNCQALLDGLKGLVQGRAKRAGRMVARLQELGLPITLEHVQARTAQGLITRMHIAQEIVEAGRARTVQDAFDKFIRRGQPAFVPKALMPCTEAIALIHQAKGLAFVAHPGIGDLHRTLDALLALPFDGIEVYHSRHTASRVDDFTRIAGKRGLFVAGGSDCHGVVKGEKPLMGTVRVPYEHFEKLKEALAAG